MNGMDGKHCCQEDLLLYYYGELDQHRCRELGDHLRDCVFCREEWQRLRKTLDGVKCPVIEPAPGELSRFASRVASRSRNSSRGRLWMLGAAATAAVVLALGLMNDPSGRFSPAGNRPVVDAAIVQELDLLQNMALLEELDLLQDLEGQG